MALFRTNTGNAKQRSNIQHFFGVESNMTKLKKILLDGAADNILNTVSWPNQSRSRGLLYERQQQLLLT